MGPEAFSADYAEARARILTAARAAGADISSEVNQAAKGAKGEELALDLLWFGPKDAEKVFIASSGMHGLEGSTGSAVQLAWICSGAPSRLPPKTAVLLLHALNAWGFSYSSRLTENNVDLNRNFLDFNHPPPENRFYHHIRDLLRAKTLDPETLGRLARSYDALRREIGPGPAHVAANGGQYSDPEGLSFGGQKAEFGHRVIRETVVPRLVKAKDVGLLDWHTGVGAYGETAFLLADGTDGPAGRRAMGWWGEARVRDWARGEEEADIEADLAAKGIPRQWSGQFYREFAKFLPNARVTGTIIEFGTHRKEDETNLVFVYLYERWLRFEDRGDRRAPAHAPVLALARSLFCPEDLAWRAMAARSGPVLMDEAINGLARQ